MTRINLIPVEELSDQHLLAEYRELPRIVNAVIGGKAVIKNIPETYRFGEGHVKFFYDKIFFLAERFGQIYNELKYRGFTISSSFSCENMTEKIAAALYDNEKSHIFSQDEIDISRKRIIKKLEQKPGWYKWTKRKRPDYLEKIL